MASSNGRSDLTKRTQEQRREATRAALLDATIDCLVQHGYANTTTRRIAERAGVTPGALQHHFATKTELVGEAIRAVWTKFAQQQIAQGPPSGPSIQARTRQALDRMWESHTGPMFQASMELLVAARTDPGLRRVLVDAQWEVARLNVLALPILFPELADRPGFPQLVATGQAAMRGLAVLGFAGARADANWPVTRDHILALNARFIHEAEIAQ